MVLGETALIPSSVKRDRLYYFNGSLNQAISVVLSEDLGIAFFKLSKSRDSKHGKYDPQRRRW